MMLNVGDIRFGKHHYHSTYETHVSGGYSELVRRFYEANDMPCNLLSVESTMVEIRSYPNS
jgi:hypothetical protein